jgi:hypothetical protein
MKQGNEEGGKIWVNLSRVNLTTKSVSPDSTALSGWMIVNNAF